MSFAFSKPHLDHIDSQLTMLDAGIEKYKDHEQLWELYYNKALVLLSVGRFAEGWKMFNTRFEMPGAKFRYSHWPIDIWDGEDVAGKHLFIWLEQGLGDQILCMSMMADMLKAVGDGSITLLCDRILVKTMRRAFPQVITYRVGEPVPTRLETWDFDYQLALTDVGRLCRNKFEDFPGTPFMKADQVKAAAFRRKYHVPGKKLVGFSWSSVSKTTGSEKTMTLAEMAPILSRDDCVFVDMQYGDHIPELIAAKEAGLKILYDPTVDQLVNMDDLFAQVAAMDMVITTSNTLAHVAGSLGVPTSVILPLGKGRLWYWFAEMATSPWYSCVSLFRQVTPGDWRAPVFKVCEMLDKMRNVCRIA